MDHRAITRELFRAEAQRTTIAPLFDIALEAGEIILSGAVTAAETVAAGDVYTVSFDGLGSLNVRFI